MLQQGYNKKTKGHMGFLCRLWLHSHLYGPLVVSAVSECGPQHNHEEDKWKPYSCACKQENRREIKGPGEHSKFNMIPIWSQMKTIIEAQYNIVHRLFSTLKKGIRLWWNKDQGMLSHFIFLYRYTLDTNKSQRSKVFEIKIRNRKVHNEIQNAS